MTQRHPSQRKPAVNFRNRSPQLIKAEINNHMFTQLLNQKYQSFAPNSPAFQTKPSQQQLPFFPCHYRRSSDPLLQKQLALPKLQYCRPQTRDDYHVFAVPDKPTTNRVVDFLISSRPIAQQSDFKQVNAIVPQYDSGQDIKRLKQNVRQSSQHILKMKIKNSQGWNAPESTSIFSSCQHQRKNRVILKQKQQRGEEVPSVKKDAQKCGIGLRNILEMKKGKNQDMTLNASKQLRMLIHKNKRFLRVEEMDIGAETADALKSELMIVDPSRLDALTGYINRQSERMLTSKMNSEAKAVQRTIRKKIVDHHYLLKPQEQEHQGDRIEDKGRTAAQQNINITISSPGPHEKTTSMQFPLNACKKSHQKSPKTSPKQNNYLIDSK